ncbi:DUF2844 domain-containing protein [Rhodoferax ferrireducens]|uniref:DUF2844 domain-containing protein n=1 Tax=Rhodoferax ferrireducens TaxID=192843 RepID=UPI000E0D98A0|nr:DUF2844 domain-containing protein [Rhodoferax ferrireducens]
MKGLNYWSNTVRVLLFILALAANSGEVMAALGRGPSELPAAVSSNPASGARMSAASPALRSSPYTLYEVLLENGTTVREYATPAGLVFAVTWRGPVLPDLNVLLGDYFKTFKVETDQMRQAGRRGSPVSIEGGGLVVRSNGRMRNFFGYAYVPDLVPAGVNIKDVLQ